MKRAAPVWLCQDSGSLAFPGTTDFRSVWGLSECPPHLGPGFCLSCQEMTGSAALRGASLATSGWSQQWSSWDPTSLEGGVDNPCELDGPVRINTPFTGKEVHGRDGLPQERDFNLSFALPLFMESLLRARQ